jgi:hypothetical protein
VVVPMAQFVSGVIQFFIFYFLFFSFSFEFVININSDELSRPENKGLQNAVNFLETVKAQVDSETKGGPISWADLIQFGGIVH